MIEKLLTVLFLSATALVCAFVAFVIFVLMPVSLKNEADCLRQGFPGARTTITLERYCTALDGTVHINVVKQP